MNKKADTGGVVFAVIILLILIALGIIARFTFLFFVSVINSPQASPQISDEACTDKAIECYKLCDQDIESKQEDCQNSCLSNYDSCMGIE